MDGFPGARTCEHCGQVYGGSHYHCSCGSKDVTSMYGHHSALCRVTGRKEGFHHCGPNGDCDRDTRESN